MDQARTKADHAVQRGAFALVAVSVPAWLALCCLKVFAVPVVTKAYSPVDPYLSNLPSMSHDVRTGHKLPQSYLALMAGKRKLVVYAACPSCSTTEARRVYRLATNSDYVLLDANTDHGFFRQVASETGSMNIHFVDGEVIGDLNVAFSPRYYEIAPDGSVAYVQADPDEDFERRP